MESEAEVIRFCNPKFSGGGISLFVAGFPPEVSRESKWCLLQRAFSQFGIVHQIQLPTCERSYAFVSFYSSLSAARARAALNQVLRIDNTVLKVQYSRESQNVKVEQRLPFTKCCELANYYLGFNGWSISVASNSCHIEQDKVICHFMVVLSIGDLTFSGWAEETIEFTAAQTEPLHVIGLARKITYQHACENCFSKVVLVQLPCGKIAVHKLSDDLLLMLN